MNKQNVWMSEKYTQFNQIQEFTVAEIYLRHNEHHIFDWTDIMCVCENHNAKPSAPVMLHVILQLTELFMLDILY